MYSEVICGKWMWSIMNVAGIWHMSNVSMWWKSGHSWGPTYPHACGFACPHANKDLALSGFLWLCICWFLWGNTAWRSKVLALVEATHICFFMPYTWIAIEKYKWGQIIDGIGDGGWNGDDYEGRWVMEMEMRKWVKMVSMHKCFQIWWLTITKVYMWFIMFWAAMVSFS